MNRRKFLVSSVAGLLLIATGATAVGAAPAQPVATPQAGQSGWSQGMGPRWQADAERPSAAVQKLLGMTAEQIQAERQAGKSLVQIAQAKGVGEAALIDTIVAEHKAQVDQLLKDGKISQAQADYMLQRQQTQVKAAVERTTVGPMAGAGFQTRGYRAQNNGDAAAPRLGGGPRFGAGMGPAANR